MKNLNSVDCLKLIMAYAVVVIHSSAISATTMPLAIALFTGQAVPFFFIVSGYLTARKCESLTNESRKEYLKQRSVKLFRLYGKWALIYLPVALYYFLSVSNSNIVSFAMQYVVLVVLDGESPYAWPLWFIYSMAIIMFILSLATRYKHTAAIGFAVFAIIHLIPYLIGDPTDGSMIEKLIYCVTWRLLGGGIYICAGMLIYRYRGLIKHHAATAAALIIASLICVKLRVPYATVFGGGGLFIFSLLIKLPDSPVYLNLRRVSMWIYYLHMLILIPVMVLNNDSGSHVSFTRTLLYGTIGSTIAGAGLIALSSRRGFGWLKKLIN